MKSFQPNSFNMSIGQYEFTLDMSYQLNNEVIERLVLAFRPELAKQMVGALNQMVIAYEARYGHIPDLNSKIIAPNMSKLQ